MEVRPRDCGGKTALHKKLPNSYALSFLSDDRGVELRVQQSDLKKLAHQFMANAVKVRPGDNTWIEHRGPKAALLAETCAVETRELGGVARMVDSGSAVINREISPLSDAEIAAYGERKLQEMKKMQAYIRIEDDADYGKVALGDRLMLFQKAMAPMANYRVNNTNWLVVAAPTEEFAADCGMSLAAFERFYCNVCLLDYRRMTQAVKPLVALMAAAKSMRVVSPAQETDLSFRKDGLGAIPCTGLRNIPDGECFTAPIKTSVNGTIKFGPSKYIGQHFEWIKLTFADGRVAAAQADTPERTKMLNKILDTDEGARYVGEFSLNFNPEVREPTGSILFDEKIDGGIHMAMGKCYADADNGNHSDIHWDMIHIQRADHGGGEIYIDDRLIRKDGRFVIPELEALNPENLKAALADTPA
jgi:aminopeptidase